MKPISDSRWDAPQVIPVEDRLFPSLDVGRRLTPDEDNELLRWLASDASDPWVKFAVEWERGFDHVYWECKEGLDIIEVKTHLETIARCRRLPRRTRVGAVAALMHRWMDKVPEHKVLPRGLSIADGRSGQRLNQRNLQRAQQGKPQRDGRGRRV